jgi:vitamin B12/bleomycin/antimicrobial peptide transport system ATP-binding/permease protein
VVTFYRYQREQLAVHWREWMTARTFALYTSNRVYYNLQSDIDNPDQRITEDVNTFTAFSLELVTTVLTSIIDLISFSVILWSIYPQLFAAIIIYAVAGTVITALLGKSLVHLNFKQLQREADLRYSLVRMRDNAESIAFYAGEDLEGRGVESRLQSAMSTRRDINTAQRNLGFFTTAYRYLIQIVPVAVVAPKYFAGDIELGVISQSVGAFNHILSDLSIIVNQFESLSRFSAGIERLTSFYEAMRAVDPGRGICEEGDISGLLQPANQTFAQQLRDELNERMSLMPAHAHSESRLEDYGMIDLCTWTTPTNHKGSILSIDNLDLCTPDRKRVLIQGLTLDLRLGQNLLIVGNSGAGKSSLLRAIAGLWVTGNGSIQRPSDDQVYFLPQRPYCTLGSLKDQLLYPSLDATANNTAVELKSSDKRMFERSHFLLESLTDQELVSILDTIDLLSVAKAAGDGDPIKGLYSVFDWSCRLSLGEQQRLAFGRLLVNRPRLVILDEATSALDMEGEARMYSLLQNMAHKIFPGKNGMSAPGLTYVSVGHRPSLLAFHDKRLRIGGGKEHDLSDVSKSSEERSIQIQSHHHSP